MGKLDDIAKEAQVSKSTVSNVLNGKSQVSERLRKRVLKVARALDTSQAANVIENTKIIGVSLNIEGGLVYSSFEQNLMRGILNICDKHEYYLLVKTNSLKKNRENILDMDGEIILNPGEDNYFSGHSHHVWIGTPPLKERERTLYVDNDNELIGYTVTEYLIKRGHKRIAFINSESVKTVSHSRKSGYEQALAEYEVLNKECLHFFLESEEMGYHQVYTQTTLLLKESTPIDAIIVNSVSMAKAVYQACNDTGKSIPEDLSVIAIYADNQSSAEFYPPLTTVNLNEYELGLEAAKLLLSIVGYEKTSGGGAIIPTTIIEKESVKSVQGE